MSGCLGSMNMFQRTSSSYRATWRSEEAMVFHEPLLTICQAVGRTSNSAVVLCPPASYSCSMSTHTAGLANHRRILPADDNREHASQTWEGAYVPRLSPPMSIVRLERNPTRRQQSIIILPYESYAFRLDITKATQRSSSATSRQTLHPLQLRQWYGRLSKHSAKQPRQIAKNGVADILQADSLTEEQVSEFKEAFSLFVSD